VFAVPTYGFVAAVFVMLLLGLFDSLIGDTPVAESAHYDIVPTSKVSGLLVVGLALRAFASGCTALTGVEAVSNGVPNFKKPKSRNADSTLLIMGALTVAMFAGITALALVSHVHVATDGVRLARAPADYHQRTVIAQVAGSVFGYHSAGFFAVQAFTAAIRSSRRTRRSTDFRSLLRSWAKMDTSRGNLPVAAIAWSSATASSSWHFSRLG
jgi:amino acid transporter